MGNIISFELYDLFAVLYSINKFKYHLNGNIELCGLRHSHYLLAYCMFVWINIVKKLFTSTILFWKISIEYSNSIEISHELKVFIHPLTLYPFNENILFIYKASKHTEIIALIKIFVSFLLCQQIRNFHLFCLAQSNATANKLILSPYFEVTKKEQTRNVMHLRGIRTKNIWKVYGKVDGEWWKNGNTKNSCGKQQISETNREHILENFITLCQSQLT